MAKTSKALETQTSVSRVLVVDDSQSMCTFLKNTIDQDPSLTVVGCAQDPFEAREMIKALDPDILTLDIEMPRMDGLAFLRNIMRLRPMPVVMISSLTSQNSSASLEAVSIGAIDFIAKREIKSPKQLHEYSESIRNLVRSAVVANVPVRAINGNTKSTASHSIATLWDKKSSSEKTASQCVDKVICIGASTGGPKAVQEFLGSLYIPRTAVVLTQHMPSRFIQAFAERLNRNTQYHVEISQDEAPLLPGRCYVAHGNSHTAIQKIGTEYFCKLVHSNKINGHQPAVDVLFHSAAEVLGNAAVGVLLTGMGDDGARGLKAMHDQGALTLAQDENSSTVWGMPGSAVRLGATDVVLPLQTLGEYLNERLKN